ncbi:FKBP-type peptidyl-prolyl cis-trans isomerase [Ottowia sp.]|uniref:FKBP-type peptidyl-prolyl cis-trans isomerase n=1 Tax=Ottowia sp. TaxID=1898956 RepID=UPI001D3373DE|nr:FKBP-type peptidyl-prolyl cis-trans isomerase [Ottowia sp.]MCP5259445.1 FKBP-type peptidyl-prolyl cis-trans isomerase [Burkholderiaceae bacterium]MCB2026210.1 FKBP-type peptidyl-prolyl cis-trans isomerase [Ottowia sp.]MCB2032497.1 FKBP-type peptidyl-prolyl cis-trans isomerase [Ottowia sp.]MCB2037239.1 FKBP-type peptidyl-prolyl cis-trans isomerase [Ottowia sp.]HPK33586.1 FKBP-type peptidyl-prolyl cis-trans isomerase [Ottowia sp.]
MVNTLPAQVQAGSFLTLHYRLAGPQGDVINTFEGQPATLTLGAGELSPALEERLVGLPEGTRTTFEVPAGAAFGDRNPDMVQWLARRELDAMGDPDEIYAIGEVVELPTPDGQGRFAGVVQAVRDDGALQLDFNHPLAGQPVTFEVHVIGVL